MQKPLWYIIYCNSQAKIYRFLMCNGSFFFDTPEGNQSKIGRQRTWGALTKAVSWGHEEMWFCVVLVNMFRQRDWPEFDLHFRFYNFLCSWPHILVRTANTHQKSQCSVWTARIVSQHEPRYWKRVSTSLRNALRSWTISLSACNNSFSLTDG